MKHIGKTPLLMLVLFLMSIMLMACSDEDKATTDKKPASNNAEQQEATEEKLLNNITLSKARGFVRDEVAFEVTDLQANEPVELVWNAVNGEYVIEDLYAVIGKIHRGRSCATARHSKCRGKMVRHVQCT